MELHVLLSGARLPDRERWQAEIAALGFDLRLDPALAVRTNRGFVPVRFDHDEGGFEFDMTPVSDLLQSYPELKDECGVRDCSANFRWSGEVEDMCALVASAALSKLADGVWFDPEEGRCLTPDAAVARAASAAREPGPEQREMSPASDSAGVRIAMTTSRKEAFLRNSVLPAFPGWKVNGARMFVHPIEDVLCQLYAERTGSRHIVNFGVSCNALYCVTDVPRLYHFTGHWEFSGRNGPSLAARLIEVMRTEGVPYLQEFGSAEKLVENIRVNQSSSDPWPEQTYAYSLAMLGRVDEAIASVERLLHLIRNEKNEWWAKTRYQAVELRQALLKGPQEAKSLLLGFRQQKAAQLGLQEYLA